MAAQEKTGISGILATAERDIQRILKPVKPGPAYREHLRQMLMATAGPAGCEVTPRPRLRLRLWLLSASGLALAVFLAQYFLRLLRRSH